MDPGAPVKVQTGSIGGGGSGSSSLQPAPTSSQEPEGNPAPSNEPEAPAPPQDTVPNTPAQPEPTDQEQEQKPTNTESQSASEHSADRRNVRPSLGAASIRQLSKPNLSSAGDSEVTASSVTDRNESGRGSEFTPLDWRRAQQARDALIAWAKENGLVDLRISPASVTDTQDASGSETVKAAERDSTMPANGGRPTLAELAPNLLDALALGAAGLYITHSPARRALHQRLRSWWKDVKPTRIAAAGARHQRVVSVFVMPGGAQPPKLVAAQINDDCIDLLVEQPLTLQAPAGSHWPELNLQAAIKSVLQAIDNLENDDYTLVLFDPELRQELNHIKPLAEDQKALRHLDLHDTLKSLSTADQQLLRQWLNRPSQTDVTTSVACSAVMDQLAQLQQHWAQFMPEPMANVAGVLELSIALANLSPSLALI